eukprot:3467285-Pyramimonas_sp.AAC.1
MQNVIAAPSVPLPSPSSPALPCSLFGSNPSAVGAGWTMRPDASIHRVLTHASTRPRHPPEVGA